MTTAFTIIVRLVNGETQTYKGDAAANFEFMTQGLLFIDGAMQKEVKQRGNLPPDEIHYRNERHWIPIAQIKDVQILTHRSLTDPEEIRKYQVFKKHNIDIMVTKISHTEPPSPEDIAKINKEAKEGEPKRPN